jgi:phosphate starvation-inducible PhoH-like protein
LRLTQIAPSPAVASVPAPGLLRPLAGSITLQFGDNSLLRLLLGDHDRYLARIEQLAGVKLSCRGNRMWRRWR